MNPRRTAHLATTRALSRRSLLAGAFGLSTASLVAGCSSYDEDAPAASGGTASPSAWEPVTVEHRYGSVEIAQRPERIVGAGLTEQDFLLALGVVPLAVTDWYGDQPYGVWPWAQDELGDAEPTLLNTNDGFQFAEISALAPDLVLALNAGITKRDYEEMSKIAPTVAQPPGATNFFPAWRPMLELIGQSLGLADEAAALQADIDALFTDAQAEHGFSGNAIFLQNAVYDGSLIAYQKGLSTDFLTDLGFDVPSNIDRYATDDGGQAYIPVERIEELNSADYLIWGTEKDADRTALEKVPGFDRLEAVRAGRSVYTGGELAGAIYFTSPLSLPYVVDNLVPLLVEGS